MKPAGFNYAATFTQARSFIEPRLLKGVSCTVNSARSAHCHLAKRGYAIFQRRMSAEERTP
jgi:hypothetical protein